MAGEDKAYGNSLCQRLGKPDLGMQDGIEGAARILKVRWHAVLSLAYALASRGALVLTTPLFGHQVMINGHALLSPLCFVRGCDLCRPGTAVEVRTDGWP